PGHAAEAGMLAAYAAAGGATASPEALSGAVGYAAAASDGTGNWDAALEGVGDWTPITRMTVKNHGCCGHIFPSVDGMRAMRAQYGFGPDDIAAIDVRGYGGTKTLCDNPDPATAQQARFSLQYCLAADMVLGGVRLAAFSPEALADTRLRRLMPKISVEIDAELAAAYPRQRMARLRVTLTDVFCVAVLVATCTYMCVMASAPLLGGLWRQPCGVRRRVWAAGERRGGRVRAARASDVQRSTAS
ncbi:MAG: hypothetical protein ACK40A_19250, partial [Pannonibacter indicus]